MHALDVRFQVGYKSVYLEAQARVDDGIWWDAHDGLAFSDVLSGKQTTHTIPVEPHLALDLDFSDVEVCKYKVACTTKRVNSDSRVRHGTYR